MEAFSPPVELLLQQDRCDKLRNPSYINLIVSIIIVLGLLISYLPQHYRIISRGTSEGISPFFVLLGTTSATSGFANILTTEPSRQDLACCKDVETFECLAGLLGITQLGVQWVCFAVILVLFLVFFRYDDANLGSDEEVDVEEQPKWQTAVMVGAVALVHGLIVIVVTGIITIAIPSQLNGWANFLGIMAAALAGIQYIPQIYTTYHLKHVGSLSIPMMCIQTPGGFLFAASLFVRMGWAGWSTWGIFILTALMQGCLLVMAVYYEFNKPAEEEAHSSVEPPALHPRRPGGPARAYSEGLEEGLPGPYTGHPERYADTPEEYDRLEAREDRAVERDNATTPLLKPSEGNGRKKYNTIRN